jgi:hypothetical protein
MLGSPSGFESPKYPDRVYKYHGLGILGLRCFC